MPRYGHLREGFTPIRAGALRGRREWTVSLERYFTEPSAAPAEPAPLVAGEEVTLEYDGGEHWWEPLVPSALRLTVRDPAGALFSRFTEARRQGKADADFRLRVASEDGVYSWQGSVRLDLVERALFPGARVPAVEIQAYCGLSSLGERRLYHPSQDGLLHRTVYGGQSLHALFRDHLAYTLQPLSIFYQNAFRPAGGEPGATMPRLRFRPFDTPDAERVPVSAQSLLQRVWQGFYAPAARGEAAWHARPAFALGRDVAREWHAYLSAEDSAFDDDDDSSEVALWAASAGDVDVAAEARLTNADARLAQRLAPRGLTVTREHHLPRYQAAAQAPFFEGWHGDPLDYWETDGQIDTRGRGEVFIPRAAFDDESRAGSMRVIATQSLRLEEGQSARQETFQAAAGDETHLHLLLEWAAVDGGGGGLAQLTFAVRCGGFALAGDGTWSEGGGPLRTAEQDAQSGGTARADLAWHRDFARSVEPLPADAPVTVELRNGSNHHLLVGCALLRFVDGSGRYEDSCEVVSRFASRRAAGEVVEIERSFLGVCSAAIDQAESGLSPAMHVPAAAGVDLAPVAAWLGPGGARYEDLARLQAEMLLHKSEGGFASTIEAQVRALCPPERRLLFAEVPGEAPEGYVLLQAEMDLLREHTEGRWVRQPPLLSEGSAATTTSTWN